ncbi:ubiquitin-like protein ISG15 [Betta splendens]|uniref:Ubiquitin-like protein ISG15 n=1 Tax=Betta splendens TaxID=158456 RepID=A0A6P7NL13_BETSP|nr:ubiquitin-like protein ISG15 [Betta splendens]
MDLTITMVGGSHTLRVEPHHTVGYVKTLVHQKLGVPPHKQRLVFVNGNRVDLSNDAQTVASCGLRSGSVVSLLVIEPPTVQVFLRNEHGGTSAYDIKQGETVKEFKARVEEREKVPVSQQRLIYEGREMGSGTLADYNVQPLGTIYLNLRLRGG